MVPRNTLIFDILIKTYFVKNLIYVYIYVNICVYIYVNIYVYI